MSTPPPIVKKFDYHSVKQINLQGNRLYEAPDGSKTPSVTTILSATKDMTGLNAWKKRMVAKYPKTFGNNYVYTMTVCFVCSSIIQVTRIM